MKTVVAFAAVLMLAGCTSQAATATAQIGSSSPATPVSAPYSQAFEGRALAWLHTQTYRRSAHHNGILLVSNMTVAGDWHGLMIEPGGALQPLNAASHDDSYAIAEQVSVGDEVEIDYHNADFLSDTSGSEDIDVLVRGAVTPDAQAEPAPQP